VDTQECRVKEKFHPLWRRDLPTRRGSFRLACKARRYEMSNQNKGGNIVRRITKQGLLPGKGHNKLKGGRHRKQVGREVNK